DRVFSFQATVPLAATPGDKALPVIVQDTQGRVGNGAINLTVLPPTDPTGVASINPSSVSPLDTTLVTVAVQNGLSPTSTGIGVTANLANIGGSSAQPLVDDGTNGDAAAGDGVYSYRVTVPWATPPGAKTMAFSVSDGQGRASNGSFNAVVLEPTPLAAFGAAIPDNVEPDGTTLLTVAVDPGTLPNSTGITVTANLTGIGGSMTQAFLDDGQNGDVLAGDGVYSYTAVVDTLTPTDPVTLPVDVADAQGRTATASLVLSIVGVDDLVAAGLATPAQRLAGEQTLLTVTVTPAANPASTAILVGANLSAIGGSTSQDFFDNATNGDVTAGDNVFSYLVTLPAAQASGAYRLPALATDAEARSAQTGITLDVLSDDLFDNAFD
ncbi:MAG TPA: choice-of-anchor X domain-containing protein, partial [Xanthomonadales bacterium]|nr:choice-of-anchor X domain-containing protein [Xanthomonadales bacterium]